MGLKTFWVEKLPQRDFVAVSRAKGPCTANGEDHRAESVPVVLAADEKGPGFDAAPKLCACGYEFSSSDDRWTSTSPRWRRLDTGEEVRGKLPPGALYVDEVMTRQDGWVYQGSDGLNVVCVLPNGNHWWIDSRCSNCTMPTDVLHRCWVRHGTVGGTVHVDKNGHTCTAGAGSIISGGWHGFLHNGQLTPC